MKLDLLGGDAFVNKGFKSWNKPDRFTKHIGGVKITHNLAYEKYVNLRDGKKKSILVSLDNATEIRGQGYDGASNMKGEIHGLKTLIIEDTPSAYYVYCFAHQLQLTLVAIAKKNDEWAWLFDTIANLLNVVGVSCKRRELIREIQAQKLAQALEIDELETGSGLNQELGLKRPGDTRWSSHYKTLLNVMDLFSTIVKVLMIIGKNGSNRMISAKLKIWKLVTCLMEDESVLFNKFPIVIIFALIPRDGFSSFDKESVLKLATFYPSDFSNIDLRSLDCQLDIFMEDMRRDNDFQNLQDLSSLSMKLVETKRDVAYPFVFLLIKLILILSVATASVESVFSGMAFMKNKLRNRIGDKPLNDCLTTFIKKEMFLQVSDDDIAHRFEKMKTRRKIN
ncbi:zinc finger MYM-type protein 1-like [Salvia splendens]|uniref:zinc finger MYM-type protein 1-like n=1 Tax=Salvia splendens TaxID=180675 RepID=UPI001C25FE8F|nr:zinc finger MYM-type protein 1-like [Salvia splendens]